MPSKLNSQISTYRYMYWSWTQYSWYIGWSACTGPVIREYMHVHNIFWWHFQVISLTPIPHQMWSHKGNLGRNGGAQDWLSAQPVRFNKPKGARWYSQHGTHSCMHVVEFDIHAYMSMHMPFCALTLSPAICSSPYAQGRGLLPCNEVNVTIKTSRQ